MLYLLLFGVMFYLISMFFSNSTTKFWLRTIGHSVNLIFIQITLFILWNNSPESAESSWIFMLLFLLSLLLGFRFMWCRSEDKQFIPKICFTIYSKIIYPESYGRMKFDYYCLMRSLLIAGIVGIFSFSRHNFMVSYIILINIFTIWAFYFDKKIAIESALNESMTIEHRLRFNNTRIPEAALHRLSLYGGGVGAFIAMHIFRHKTNKNIFYGMIFSGIAINLFVYYLVIA